MSARWDPYVGPCNPEATPWASCAYYTGKLNSECVGQPPSPALDGCPRRWELPWSPPLRTPATSTGSRHGGCVLRPGTGAWAMVWALLVLRGLLGRMDPKSAIGFLFVLFVYLPQCRVCDTFSVSARRTNNASFPGLPSRP